MLISLVVMYRLTYEYAFTIIKLKIYNNKPNAAVIKKKARHFLTSTNNKFFCCLCKITTSPS